MSLYVDFGMGGRKKMHSEKIEKKNKRGIACSDFTWAWLRLNFDLKSDWKKEKKEKNALIFLLFAVCVCSRRFDLKNC